MRDSFLLALLLLGAACNCSGPSATQPGPAVPKATSGAPDPFANLPAAAPEPRERSLAAAMQRLLEREHLRPHPIDDEVAQKALDRYLDRLDPGKLLLLQSHVEAVRQRAKSLDDEFREGDFRTARKLYALLRRQRQGLAEKVDAMLAKPFDLTDDESLETDAEKRDWAVDQAALVDRWRRLLERQTLERIGRMQDLQEALDKGKTDEEVAEEEGERPGVKPEPPPPTFEGREKRAREELRKSYAGRFSRLLKSEPLEAAELFLNAFASAYDPHSLYLAPAEQENFDIEMSGSLEGIGAVLSEDDHYILVREVVPGGAAWRQGKLEAGDLILSVAQVGKAPVDVADMRINEVVKMIRGPKGTHVVLAVQKPDDRILSIRITRDVVVVEATYARGAVLKLDAKHEPVGYVALPGFYGNTRHHPGGTPERDATADVKALLQLFSKKGLKAMVLDLRGNGGGLLDHATGITGLLVDKGPVVKVKNARGKEQVLADTVAGVSFGGEVVILVDRFSASASEILAGALQDYGRALIVGTSATHGKGTVQALIELGRVVPPGPLPLGVAKLTVQQFFLVDGESTQWRGVQPDVTLPDTAAHLETGERYLDNAIPFSKVEPLITKPPEVRWDRAALAAQSQARQAQQPVFGKVKERQAYFERRQKQSRVRLSREGFMADRAKDKKALENLDLELDKGPERFGVEPVNYRKAKGKGGTAQASIGKDRLERWTETLARDPWLEEALRVVDDMKQGQAKPAP